jgi:hypothetical protein
MRTSKCYVWLLSCVVSVVLLGCSSDEPPPRASATVGVVTKDRRAKSAAKNPASQETDALFTPLTSLVQVLANPDKYRGKTILVKGFLRVEHEGNAIYLSENDDYYLLTSNAFWVSWNNNALGLSDEEVAQKFNGKYVTLGGTFNDEDHGHMGMFQGEFVNVTQLRVVRDRSELRKLRQGISQGGDEEIRAERIEGSKKKDAGR